MHSCIYEGRVRHRRIAPVAHAFEYGLFMMYLDLDELPTAFCGHPLWSVEGRGLARFRRRDHLKTFSAGRDLRDCVLELVRRETGRAPAGPIRLLTQLEYFGYRFNPVSFFYCFDATGAHVEAIVAEINNTPWGQQHCYVLAGGRERSSRGDRHSFELSKEFHISPFMGMNTDYVWHFSTPGRALAIHMDNLHVPAEVASEGSRAPAVVSAASAEPLPSHAIVAAPARIASQRRGERKYFDATLTLRRREISRVALTRVLLRYPFMTARIIGAIYWQAARLWWKRCPYFAHPAQARGPATHHG